MEPRQPDPGRVDRLQFHNSHKHALRFVIEPWGEVFPMDPGAVFEVVARGPAEGQLEVAFAGDSITVYGWPGSVVSAFQGGRELGGPGKQAVPGIPPGQSIRGFVGWMFDQTGTTP